MTEKEQLLLQGTSAAAGQLTELAEQVADATSQAREIGEALHAAARGS